MGRGYLASKQTEQKGNRKTIMNGLDIIMEIKRKGKEKSDIEEKGKRKKKDQITKYVRYRKEEMICEMAKMMKVSEISS